MENENVICRADIRVKKFQMAVIIASVVIISVAFIIPLMQLTNGPKYIVRAFTEGGVRMSRLQTALGVSVPIAPGAGILCSIPLAFASKISGNRLTLTEPL